MKEDPLRPGWRAFMLFYVRSIVCPIANGKIPQPPHCEGEPSPITVLDTEFPAQVPLDSSLACYQFLDRAWARHRGERLTRQRVQHLVTGGQLWWDGLTFHPEWAVAVGPEPEPRYRNEPEWVRWSRLMVLNIVASFRWGMPFPVILHVAREGPAPLARAALYRALVVDKTALTLPWVGRRVEEAAGSDDWTFLRMIGQALAVAPVPENLKAHSVDVFLCFFNVWLKELSLGQQTALLREGGVKMTVKTLRNRRSRVGLTRADDESPDEVPPALLPMIQRAEEIFRHHPDDYRPRQTTVRGTQA